MCPGQEVSQIDKLALSDVLDVDETPLGSSPANNLPGWSGDDVLGANNGKRQERLDVAVQLSLFGSEAVLAQAELVRIHSEVVVFELFLQNGLEVGSFLQGQGVCLGDHRHHVGDLCQFSQRNDVQFLEPVVRRLDEVENAVDSSVFDNRLPALFVVHLVAKSWRVDHVQGQLDVILHQSLRRNLHLAGLVDRLVDRFSAARVNHMLCKQRVDQRALSQARVANNHNIQREAPFKKSVFDLRGDRVESNVGFRLQQRSGIGDALEVCHIKEFIR
ncbi:hypothetical protein OGATHE_005671 [Ogataea polymorpha]|uniref:Uncharacterized protein n=1 Tax=Ogataea polymorpha TaxID=460523 RepID=A0A9P8SYR4_9ASCO|nr:hypothetical protein OGATHE_005671 [Ogataea polymorpha]